jgi:hypothetical protein
MTTMIYSAEHPLDAVAIPGPVRVEAEADEFFGGPDSLPYRSRVMMNPTWRQLMRCAAAQARKTLDEHHVFLEDFDIVRVDDNVTVIRLILGS